MLRKKPTKRKQNPSNLEIVQNDFLILKKRTKKNLTNVESQLRELINRTSYDLLTKASNPEKKLDWLEKNLKILNSVDIQLQLMLNDLEEVF